MACEEYTGYKNLNTAKSHVTPGHLFELEPMLDKSTLHVPGIGIKAARRFWEQGYDRAFVLFGQFLLFKQNPDQFCSWLQRTGGMTKACAKRTVTAFQDYALVFL